MTNIQKKDESDSLRFLFGLFRCLIAGWGTATVLAFLLSAVAANMEDANSFITPFAYAALFGGALGCGIFSRRHGLLLPLVAGCAYCVSLWLVSLFLGDESGVGSVLGVLLCYLACVAVSFAAGTVGCSGKKFRSDGKKSPAVQLRRRIGRR